MALLDQYLCVVGQAITITIILPLIFLQLNRVDKKKAFQTIIFLLFSLRRVQAQLDEETGRHSDLKSKQVKQEKDLKELQAELKKSRIKSMKEQEKYNNILQV